MKKSILSSILVLLLISCNEQEKSTILKSPNETISLEFGLTKSNTPFYFVSYQNKVIIDTSRLGIIREDADFYSNLKIVNISKAKSITDHYTMFHGKQKEITYTANQYVINLKNDKGNLMNIIFNLSNDGIGFRYHFPEKSEEIKKIVDEKTTYNFIDDTKSWIQPIAKAKSGWSNTNPSYEEHYATNVPLDTEPEFGEGWVYPALFKTNSTWTLITETGLGETYCGTKLKYDAELKAMKVSFPQKEEFFPGGPLNPESKLPWYTPWRIITMGSLATITESTLGTDLADSVINMDTSFVKSGLSSWSWVLLKDDFTNYETSIKFIDYASEMNWAYCLIDADWDTKIGYEKMKELASYAKTKDVKIIVWYNSAGSWNTTPYHPKSKLLTHKDRLNEFSKLNKMGVSGVKVDFFGGDGQSMIAYYHGILQDAAKHKILVNFHGATLPRGWHRTYPNLMTMESIMGEEFITFDQKNADAQPSHCTILPFTRNAFDPMDFTPMVLDSIPNINRITTASFELALPTLFLSGIQHMAEIPKGMAKQPDYIVEYLKDIPTNWDESKFLKGFPGKDVIIARRKENTWFITAINGENFEKKFELDLSFIKNKKGLYINDGTNGFIKTELNLNQSPNVTITMQAYGGFVMKF